MHLPSLPSARWLCLLLSCLSTTVLSLILLPAVALATAPTAPTVAYDAVAYDVVYVRQPRRGDNTHIVWPEVCHPGRVEPGSDLMLLHPNGAEEVLVVAGNGAVTDPFISFDGQWVYYVYFPDARLEQANYQRGYLPLQGSDIYRLHLASRRIERLTHQEFTPNLGAGAWDESNPVNPAEQFNRLGYGILNLGPAPLPGGKIIFTSNRNGFVPTKEFTLPAMQLFVMDQDGANVTPIAPMTIGSALHPTPLADGRVAFSTYETQGMRDSRLWGLWDIWPDGRQWGPLVSAFMNARSFHFVTQLSNSDLVVTAYYNCNNFGFGALYRFPVNPPAGQARFHNAFLGENPAIAQIVGGGFPWPARMGFTPRGLVSITPFTHAEDEAAPCPGANVTDCNAATRLGKFTHPSAAPDNNLLVVWSPGPVNALPYRPTDLPAVDAGLYVLPNGGPVQSPSELVLLKNDPNYNEVWPRAVVTYRAIHGVDEPTNLPWLPNDGSVHPQLPAGTPYGLIGSSSFYRRESFPGALSGSPSFDGLDVFNTGENEQSSNWFTQGSDAGKYTNDDIWAVRIVAMEANTHRSYGPHEGQHFFNHVNEKLRILGEIPLRKFDANGNPIRDPDGNPDTSFLAKIPADTPFTFQMLDRKGRVLTMAQTWHQMRPGEMRADCGGCHAHSQLPLAFAQTAAASPNYQVWDLVNSTPLLTANAAGAPTLRTVNAPVVNVEFYQDIRPILDRSCVSCHQGTAAPAALRLDVRALVDGPPYSGIRVPGDYARLCFDKAARWGYAPVIGRANGWRQTNASRYVRPFQSRRSLLLWKIFGERSDGWTNASFPTETTPGNPATLPAGADPNTADLNFLGAIMPPPGSAVPGLSMDEKLTFARWIDLGCPINAGQGDNANFGWFIDDNRPTLAVSLPRAGQNASPLSQLRVGIADAYTGIAPGSLSIKADIAINGRAAGQELADLAQPAGEGIYTIALAPPVSSVALAHLRVQVADRQGNVTRVNQQFSVASPPDTLIFADNFEGGNLSAWSRAVIDGGDLSVSHGAALEGSRGLQVFVDDLTPIYVTDDRPNAESEYQVQLRFDPNSLPMNNGSAHTLFYGYVGTSTPILRLDLRFANNGYFVRPYARNDGATWLTSAAWYPISDGRHDLVLSWRAATAVGANNGRLRLLINGVQKANLTTIDNDTRRLDRVRLGAVVGIDAGTFGAYFLDAFASYRTVVTSAAGDEGEETPFVEEAVGAEEEVPEEEEGLGPLYFLPLIMQ